MSLFINDAVFIKVAHCPGSMMHRSMCSNSLFAKQMKRKLCKQYTELQTTNIQLVHLTVKHILYLNQQSHTQEL